ncbi:MAG: DUF4870 domain-containing protein [Anaerolineae bacterium]|nr:DUF4870 domain-containing protein [Anaerolineae bacterium]MBN8617731.1 DUF4870 domain-containing protein [Anaerolineae bacterium]
MTEDSTSVPDHNDRVSRLSAVSQSLPDEELVHEYEARYQEPLKRKVRPRSYSTMNVSDEEKLWASIAHASIWITMLGGLFTVGFVVPVSIFIPLVIYFLFRKKSDYVVFHAMQAFVLQVIGTIGVLVLALVGGVAWTLGMVIALLAVFVLAGIVLVPLWAIVGIILALVIFLTPLAALLFGTIAAVETYNRRDYRYPFISRWIDRQLAGGFLNSPG